MKRSTKKTLKHGAIVVAAASGIALLVRRFRRPKPFAVSGLLDDITSLFGGDDATADAATDAHGGHHGGGKRGKTSASPSSAPRAPAPHAAPPRPSTTPSAQAPGSNDATFSGEFVFHDATASDLATMLDDSTTAAPASPGD